MCAAHWSTGERKSIHDLLDIPNSRKSIWKNKAEIYYRITTLLRKYNHNITKPNENSRLVSR